MRVIDTTKSLWITNTMEIVYENDGQNIKNLGVTDTVQIVQRGN